MTFFNRNETKEERLRFRSFNKKKEFKKDILKYETFLYKLYQQVADRLVKDFHLETVFFKRYCMINQYGTGEFQIPHMEIRNFLFELTRFLVRVKIKKNDIVPSDFSQLNPIVFYSLVTPISNETRFDLPIYGMENSVEILINSLKHPFFRIQKKASEFLAEIYHSDYTNNQLKNRIYKLRLSYKLLEESISTYFKRKSKQDKMDQICPDTELTYSEKNQYIKILNWISKNKVKCP